MRFARLQGARLEGDAVVLSADAVVIGSGAGGGVTAALLAEAGAKVWTTYFEKQYCRSAHQAIVQALFLNQSRPRSPINTRVSHHQPVVPLQACKPPGRVAHVWVKPADLSPSCLYR